MKFDIVFRRFNKECYDNKNLDEFNLFFTIVSTFECFICGLIYNIFKNNILRFFLMALCVLLFIFFIKNKLRKIEVLTKVNSNKLIRILDNKDFKLYSKTGIAELITYCDEKIEQRSISRTIVKVLSTFFSIVLIPILFDMKDKVLSQIEKVDAEKYLETYSILLSESAILAFLVCIFFVNIFLLLSMLNERWNNPYYCLKMELRYLNTQVK